MASGSEVMAEMSEVVIVIPEAPPTTTTTTNQEQSFEKEEEEEEEEEAAGDEALALDKEAVIVKGTEDVEEDVFYPVTCGEAKASLVWKKFVCPGINVKCVQFNSQLISPKEFVCLAGKSTLKDWKRAIRLNGTMLRKIMDSGELDFFQHSKVCSNTCRSTKIDPVGPKPVLNLDPGPDLSHTDLNGVALSLSETATDEASEWVTTIGEDSVLFWRGIKEAGLLDHVIQEFEKELQETLTGLEERVHHPPLEVKDAVLLNDMVQNLGMLDLVKKVLASHKNQMDQCRQQYSRSLQALEQQCDEHRKRAKELKSRSQHLNNVLMTLAPVPPPSPSPKRPRLSRAASGPAAVGAGAPQISLNLGKVLTLSGAPGAYTLLTSPLPGADLGADSSNLTLLQEGGPGGFVKVLGPQFQLLTLPTALQGQAPGVGLEAPGKNHSP